MAAGLTLADVAAAAAETPGPGQKIVGPETCVECHLDQIQVWKHTVHQHTFRELPRKPETEAMLGRLGLTRFKGEPQCQACHFTTKDVDGESQAVAGIACESCHGPAADWVKTHGDYGGPGATAASETPAHRAARLARADAAGMLGPRTILALGQACYDCHLVPDERIVNVGGHPAGSPGFNLLTWLEGEVRHDVPRTGDKVNPEAPLPRRRLLFVLGCILETEHGFRAVAAATERATFALAQARRADAARRLLARIDTLVSVPELSEMVAVAQAARLRLHNRDELVAAADRLAQLARAFAARVDGSQLAGVDALLPGAAQYRGTPYQFPQS
ncbi:MAG TPA: multiheme c-type cytochrome [Lacunisphaera sp.]|nr:multiheme c-type cytochrome [Lacunisphaera sp.]